MVQKNSESRMKEVALEVVVTGEVRGVIRVPLDTDLFVLKGMIAQQFDIETEMRLILAGKILTDSQTISGLYADRKYQIHVLMEPDHFSVKVITPGGKDYVMSAAKATVTEDFIAQVAENISMPIDYIVLVHRGKVIGGKVTLNHWGITEGSVIRIVSVKKRVTNEPRPPELIDELFKLVSEIIAAPQTKQKSILARISAILEDKKLQAHAKFDRDLKQQMDDVLMILDSADLQNSSRTDGVIAQINDLTITQFEESREGMKILEEVFLNKSHEPEMVPMLRPNTDYLRQLSEDPLPVWWSVASSDLPVPVLDDERKLTMRQRFRREISALKKMGFSDEMGILMALKQTSGNVPQAARILMKNGRCY